jgi:hypothetical protein
MNDSVLDEAEYQVGDVQQGCPRGDRLLSRIITNGAEKGRGAQVGLFVMALGSRARARGAGMIRGFQVHELVVAG